MTAAAACVVAVATLAGGLVVGFVGLLGWDEEGASPARNELDATLGALREGGAPLVWCSLAKEDCYDEGRSLYERARVRAAKEAFRRGCLRGHALSCVGLGSTQVAGFEIWAAKATYEAACALDHEDAALACAREAALRAEAFDDLPGGIAALGPLCARGEEEACTSLSELGPRPTTAEMGGQWLARFKDTGLAGGGRYFLFPEPLDPTAAARISDAILAGLAEGALPAGGQDGDLGMAWCFPTAGLPGNVHCFFTGRRALNVAMNRAASRIEQAGESPGPKEHRSSERNRFWGGQNLRLAPAREAMTWFAREKGPLLPEEEDFWNGLVPRIEAMEGESGRTFATVTANAVSGTRAGVFHHELLHALYFADPVVRETMSGFVRELPDALRREAFARLAPFYASTDIEVREGELFAYLAMRDAEKGSFVARVPGLLERARAEFARRGIAERIEALAPGW